MILFYIIAKKIVLTLEKQVAHNIIFQRDPHLIFAESKDTFHEALENHGEKIHQIFKNAQPFLNTETHHSTLKIFIRNIDTILSKKTAPLRKIML